MRICSYENGVHPEGCKEMCFLHYISPRETEYVRLHATCKIKNCNASVVALGYCAKHYEFRNRSKVCIKLKDKRVCSANGCERLHHALGYCRHHYYLLRTYGKPEHPLQKSSQANSALHSGIQADDTNRRSHLPSMHVCKICGGQIRLTRCYCKDCEDKLLTEQRMDCASLIARMRSVPKILMNSLRASELDVVDQLLAGRTQVEIAIARKVSRQRINQLFYSIERKLLKLATKTEICLMSEQEVATCIFSFIVSNIGTSYGYGLCYEEGDGFTIHEHCPSGVAESTKFVGRLDNNTLFVRWISINSRYQRHGCFRKLIKFLFFLSSKNQMELFFESCIDITRDVIREEVESHYSCNLKENDLSDITGKESTDMDISFRYKHSTPMRS